MKKSKRFLCMLIAAVMLLGAFPAHAASAPPAATYKAASPTRLPDGTTGATVGMTGLSKVNRNHCGQPDYTNEKPYGTYIHMLPLAIQRSGGWLLKPNAVEFTTDQVKNGNKTVYVKFNPSDACLDDFIGLKLPAGYLYDFYRFEQGNGYTFMCQYDTRNDTDYFAIPCAPGDNPNSPKPRKAAPVRTSFNDIQPGSKYYDAVTALARNKLIHGVFDEDPSGNFNPDKQLTDGELQQILTRMGGIATEKYAWTRGEPATAVVCKMTEDQIKLNGKDPANPDDHDYCGCTHKGVSVSEGFNGKCNPANRHHVMNYLHLATQKNVALSPEQQALAEQRWNADQAEIARMIDDYLAVEYDGKILRHATIPGSGGRPGGLTRQQMADYWKTNMRATWDCVFTDGATEAGLADGSYLYDGITRGQLCLALYRFGLTSFGCCEGKGAPFM